MRYLILFLALVAVAVVAVLVARPRARDRAGMPDEAGQARANPIVGLSEPDPVLPPVLLPERPRKEDIDAVRFSVGLRGYRCDQVDGVLDSLAQEIDRLSAELEEARSGKGNDAENPRVLYDGVSDPGDVDGRPNRV
jgi:DivIVA domain-containing protein